MKSYVDALDYAFVAKRTIGDIKLIIMNAEHLFEVTNQCYDTIINACYQRKTYWKLYKNKEGFRLSEKSAKVR